MSTRKVGKHFQFMADEPEVCLACGQVLPVAEAVAT
jgi:hypothetical protein